ncbi:hypothetical protein KLP28_06970 [Nocardioidaceae bacterium]|nr:hypothetical protein KLP28_06970 [Nocardioidaceae bacterium]
MAPQSVPQLLLFLTFVVPGFVYQSVRISVRGRLPLDVELSARIVRAVVASAIFGLVYVAILGRHLVDAVEGRGFVLAHPRLAALLALAGGIVIPSVVALVRLPEWDWVTRLREWAQERLPEFVTYDVTPTAWDKTFQSSGECFIRVLNREGRWAGGYYGANSYATSFPEPQQLFLERAYVVSEDGTFEGEVPGSAGVLLDCSDLQLLQVLRPDEDGAAEQVGEKG